MCLVLHMHQLNHVCIHFPGCFQCKSHKLQSVESGFRTFERVWRKSKQALKKGFFFFKIFKKWLKTIQTVILEFLDFNLSQNM